MFDKNSKIGFDAVFIRRDQTAVQSFTPKIIFSNDELHIILKGWNLEICKHSSFLIIDEIVF